MRASCRLVRFLILALCLKVPALALAAMPAFAHSLVQAQPSAHGIAHGIANEYGADCGEAATHEQGAQHGDRVCQLHCDAFSSLPFLPVAVPPRVAGVAVHRSVAVILPPGEASPPDHPPPIA